MANRRIDRVDIVLNWAAAFLLAFALTLLDPFGLSEGADHLSERTVLGGVAPFLNTPDTPRAGQTRITVVVVDDRFLERFRQTVQADATWPISRADQVSFLLEPILEHRPRALFVDWVFHAQGVAEGDRASALADQLDEIYRFDPQLAGTRLLLSDRPPRAPEDQRTGCPHRITTAAILKSGSHSASALQKLWDRPWAERVAIRHWGREDRYPLAPLAVLPEEADVNRPAGTDCPPFPATQPGTGDPTRLLPSAALALFSLWCESDDPLAAGHSICAPRPGRRTPMRAYKVHGYVLHSFSEGIAGNLGLPAAPQWLWYQTPLMREIARTATTTGRTASAAPDPCQRANGMGAWAALVEGLRLRLGSPDVTVPFNPCIAIDTISASDLQSLGEGLSDKALAALFHKRLVLIGANLDAAPDRASSPVNGTVPAVLVHATVLENLISDGTHRSREPPTLWPGVPGGKLGNILVTALAGIPFGLLMIALTGRLSDLPEDAYRHLWISLGIALGALGLVASAVLWPGWLRWQLPVAGLVGGAVFGGALATPTIRNMVLVVSGLALGLTLPLAGGVALYLLTNWAPANWGAATLWKVALPGGATAALTFAFSGPRNWLQVRLQGMKHAIRTSTARSITLAAVLLSALLLALLIATWL